MVSSMIDLLHVQLCQVDVINVVQTRLGQSASISLLFFHLLYKFLASLYYTIV